MGAIQIGTAKAAWKAYNPSKLEGMDDSAIMRKLITDDKFNIETIALVLLMEAKNSGVIRDYSETGNLTYEKWATPITLYNGSSEYAKKVQEYLPYIKTLLK